MLVGSVNIDSQSVRPLYILLRQPERQSEPDFGARDLLWDPIGCPGWNLTDPRPRPESHRKAEFPYAFTKLERQQQRRPDWQLDKAILAVPRAQSRRGHFGPVQRDASVLVGPQG